MNNIKTNKKVIISVIIFVIGCVGSYLVGSYGLFSKDKEASILKATMVKGGIKVVYFTGTNGKCWYEIVDDSGKVIERAQAPSNLQNKCATAAQRPGSSVQVITNQGDSADVIYTTVCPKGYTDTGPAGLGYPGGTRICVKNMQTGADASSVTKVK